MSTPMKRIKPPRHYEAFRLGFAALLAKHGAELTAEDMLAVSSYLVGQLIALQDQRKMTPADAIELVQANIAQGNQDAIDATLGKTAGRA